MFAAATTLLASVALPLLATSASADTPTPLPVTATATTPTTGLVDGSIVHFHVDANGTVAGSVFGVEARICQQGADIQNSADFAPTTGGICATTALSAGTQNFSSVGTAPPNLIADLDFKVGVGSSPLADVGSGPGTLTCGPGSPCTIWLKMLVPAGVAPAGQAYQHFDISFAAPATAPGAPTGLAGTPGNGSAALSWTAPASDGGAAIDHYTVTPSVGSPIDTVGPVTNLNVTGLANFTPVTFTVKAHNSVGFGPDSAPTMVTPAPAAPTNVLASAGNGSAAVTWTAPPGPAPTTYTVTATPAAGAPVVVPGTSTTATVPGLTNGTSYTFSVVANYPTGDSAPGVSPAVTPSSTFITQHISVTRPQGALIIGEACSGVPLGTYPQDCTVDLGTAALNASGTYYLATGAFDEVTVLDTRDTNPGWTVNVQSTPFTGVNPANTFSACNLGYGAPTANAASNIAPNVQNVTPGPAVAASCPAGGLGVSHTFASAAAGQGQGYAYLNASIGVQVPVSAAADVYTAVVTFTAL
ncbi:MAG: fibronectin type III domain-containing protein [Acidimicrobiales bacterium]